MLIQRAVIWGCHRGAQDQSSSSAYGSKHYWRIYKIDMSVLGAFCNQLIRFFEELQVSFPEEKSISMSLEAIKAGKRSNPKLMLDMFYEHMYKPANDLIMARKEDEILALAKKVLSTQFNELMPALMIFDKYWPGMTPTNRDVIWQYLEVLCKLCEKAKA